MHNNIFEAIRKFADQAHGLQTRKYSGERYIVHPVKVMRICEKYSSDPVVLAAALLHDVLEDTPVTSGEIEAFLGDYFDKPQVVNTLKLVHELTDIFTKAAHPRLNRKQRKRNEALRLSKTSADAQTIKYADILDNALDIVEADADFGVVYLRESLALLKGMKKGNAQLYKVVLTTVNECLLKLTPFELSNKKNL